MKNCQFEVGRFLPTLESSHVPKAKAFQIGQLVFADEVAPWNNPLTEFPISCLDPHYNDIVQDPRAS